MKKIALVIGVSALLTGFAPGLYAQSASPAAAPAKAAAPATAKAKKIVKPAKAKKPPVSVVVKITNSRSVAVSSLTILLSGTSEGGMSLAKPLEAGKKTTLKLNTKMGCTFDVSGAYADEAVIEADSLDFCADPSLVLKD